MYKGGHIALNVGGERRHVGEGRVGKKICWGEMMRHDGGEGGGVGSFSRCCFFYTFFQAILPFNGQGIPKIGEGGGLSSQYPLVYERHTFSGIVQPFWMRIDLSVVEESEIKKGSLAFGEISDKQVAASLMQACYLAVIKPISGCVRIACSAC